MTVKAKVVAVDKENRTITLEGKGGKAETFAVGPAVKRLDEIAPGDVIVLKYEQGLLLQFAPEGATSAAPSVATGTARGDADKPPAGAVAGQVRGTVTVTAVDQKTRTVVLETPKGELFKVKADKSIDLKKVKAGQKYDGVYSETVAVSVQKAKPPEKK
jgi:carbon monoxide dehydrogenase subunit G